MTAVTGNPNRSTLAQSATSAKPAGNPQGAVAHSPAAKGLPAEDSVTRDNPERETQRRTGARNAALDNTQAQRSIDTGDAAKDAEAGRLALDLKARGAVRV